MRAFAVCALLASGITGAYPRPSIEYTLRIDPARLDVVQVAVRITDAPGTLRLAMKVHPEYDARYWRYLDSMRVDSPEGRGGVIREDSTLWRVTLPGGSGTVRYRIHVQQQPEGQVGAWRSLVRRSGAMINSPDFFLYLPDFATASVSLDLDVPQAWRVATSLRGDGAPTRLTAASAAELLDAPILVGDWREWSFRDRGTRFHVVYWPLPDAATFDTASFVDEMRRLAAAALDVFGSAPVPEYYFLIEDGAVDALEHRASVTIGVRSASLQRNPRASLTELAHELFHTWNLVAIHPDEYGALSYERPAPTAGLWWGEGVTMYYADALPRRAGLIASDSRLDHLGAVLTLYYGAPWITRVSPERASLAFGDSPVANPDVTGGYYVQGELLGGEIDALVRNATGERRGIDDIMRGLYQRSHGTGSFRGADLEVVADSVCGCRLNDLFATQVRGSAPIDVSPIVARLGLRLLVDTTPAVDTAGAALPDLRIGMDFTRPAGPLLLVLSNPASAWSAAGLRTGDELVALNAHPMATFGDLQRVLHGLRVGDSVGVEIRRGGAPLRLRLAVAGYRRPRVRFEDLAVVSAEQRARRAAWLAGR